MNELPSGWSRAALPELVASDGVFSDGDWVESKDQDPSGDVRLIQLADVGDGYYRDRSARFLTLAKAHQLGCTFLQNGDVLIARMPDPLGRACCYPGDAKRAVTVVDVCIIRPGRRSVNPRWLMYTINAPQSRSAMTAYEKGTTRRRISRSNLARIPLPIPPLAEQGRIVAAVEEQFSRLDAGLVALERVRRDLKRLRAAVLQVAADGRLTTQWRSRCGDVEPADILIKRLLDQRRQVVRGRRTRVDVPVTGQFPVLPEGWSYTRIEPLLSADRPGMKTGPFGSLLKKFEHRSEGVPVLGIENVEPMHFIPGSRIHISRKKAEDLSTYDVHPGDVLISRSGTVGEVCVVPEDLGEARFSTNLMRVALNTDGILPEFFALLFNGSYIVLAQVSELCKGTTRAFLNQEILSAIVFPIPPLAEQQEILSQLGERLSWITDMECQVNVMLRRVPALRHSILSDCILRKAHPSKLER